MKIRVLNIDVLVGEADPHPLRIQLNTLVACGAIKWEVWAKCDCLPYGISENGIPYGLCENGETLPAVIRGFCQTLDEVYQRKIDASELLASLADELEKMAVETRGKAKS